MKMTVGFFSLARRLSKTKSVVLEITPGATLRDVLVKLGDQFPMLLGELIVPESYDLREPYFFNINGRRVAKNLDEQIQEGEELLLMSINVGG